MAQREAGHQIYRLQEGFDPKDWKPLHGVGPGIREIRIHAENEYRIIYVAQFEEALYILHSFVKKTQKTSQRDLELARERLNQVLKGGRI
ncbi:MAG: type II toxin-antitoxin system RelE/ParE family toxin [Leptospirillum sp.]|nr:type II toxin-antitoxin system RelE/ParE family toxin [Nitrospiraceae bacterium]